MALTIPMFSFPYVWSSTQNLFRVTYTDLSTQTLSVPAGTYFPDGSTSGLLSRLQTDFNADAPAGGTWVVAFDSNYKISITKSGGSKTVSFITALLPDVISLEDLGYDTAGTNIINNAALPAADWRPARMWSPDEYVLSNMYTLEADIVMQRSRQSGRIAASMRSAVAGIQTYEYNMEYVPGPLVWDYAANDATLYNQVTWMQQYDPNASLERFYLAYMANISSFQLPRARVALSRSAPNTNTAVRLLAEQPALSDVISKFSETPLYGNILIKAIPYVI